MIVEIAGQIRVLALSHPLGLVLVAAAICWPILRRQIRPERVSLVRRAVGIGGLAVYLAIVAWYVSVPQYSDHAEPSVAAVSWLVAQGGSPYHSPGAEERYAFPYGPVLYLANAGPLLLFGPSLASSKLAGVAAALLSILLVSVACRRVGGSVSAALTGLTIGFLLFGSASFWVRSEPLLLLASAMALSVTDARWHLRVFVVGLAVGLGLSTKITAAVYLTPALAMLWFDEGWKPLLAALVIGIAAFALPFTDAAIRAGDYVYWTRSALQHGLRWRSIPTAFEWALVIAAVPALGLWSTVRGGGIYGRREAGRVALVACVLGTAVLAAKRGTGEHHFLPFVPVLVFLESGTVTASAAFLAATRRYLASSLVIGAAIGAAVKQVDWIAVVATGADVGAVAEVRQMGHRYDGPLAIGYSTNYRLSFLRPLPVFAGQPYQLDAVALMDLRLAGRPLPTAMLSSLSACRMNVWLIPRGGEPFALGSAYDARVPVFGPEFIALFKANYGIVEQGRYFDVWVCRHLGQARRPVANSRPIL
jgi:hypothetical protein